ncbi:ataxin-7-like protein 1 isoform X3 [Panthera pardus]|uniref:Ataxin-7-like protein 1 isoform X3 n=2 Tax=Felidae TaxID=9681 RepID=A0A6J2AFZ9_ACIJB|nr:ataxin-7-like protein 1 isoform X3 [Panthera pardus]XP_023106031.2 ataxin-7-like protein 1 isoform X3 [Felis catus]XP_026927489.1 ataxin-7-like protein 1 isoform X3 [Acinonyx jubatus]XP_040328835.1 ataxin-7-like protein 1 isoform X3 [Puma yagouaroundi]XP_045350435.1 ataxin-7-like protein 1 isoform X3 [Leopardus geoffroyi]XP_047697205.1 ataxin-7-like protein 1 isoform X3 [Prionailurus viverrinus]XP_060489775.1 ataxin-7-like protein 1 isoform X3 [Panthera onca]
MTSERSRIPCLSAAAAEGTGKKQQEGRAMATLDRKVPSPEAFLGKPWSSWIDAAKLHCSDNVDLEEAGKEGGKSREVMRLNKEERRHGSMCRPSPSPASPPSNSRTSLGQVKTKACLSGQNSANSISKPFKTPKDNLLTSSSKQHTVFSAKGSRDKACVPVPVVSLEKIPNLVKADGANVKMNSTTTTAVTSCSTSSSAVSTPPLIKPVLMSKSVPPSPEKILNGKGILPATIDKKHQNGTKNNNKPYRRLSEREFDPNKHCGVLDPETKKPCTRSLTCKTHSLSHRRAVPGRKKQFDLLLAEHKAKSREKEVKDKEHLLTSAREVLPNQPGPAQDSLPGPSGSSGPEPKVASPAKSRPPNSVLPRPSSANSISSNTSSNHSGCTPEPPLPPAGGDLTSRLSSDEGEMDGADEPEKLDCHFSTHHPRPLAFCSFGSRLMGRGYYVFDRRWDRFRFALNSMVEKHLNSQMWKHRNPSHRASGPSPLFRTCLTNLLSLSNIGAAWVSTLESVAPRCPLNLAAQTPGPDGPEPGGMAADGGVEDIRKKRNGQDSFFFNKHLTLHQETPTQYSLSARKIPPAADSPMPSPAAHTSTPVPASVLQPFSNPSAVYLPSAPISSRLTSSYIMTSAMLSNAAFVASPDPSALMSHTTAFPHVAATLSIMDSTFKAPSAVSPIPAAIPSPSHKPSKTKTSKSSKVKDLSARSDESPSNKKRKPQPSTSSSSSSLSLQTSLSSPLSGPHKKNCVLNASSALNSYQAAPPYNSLSVHNSNNGVSPLSAKLEPSGRTSLPSGPADIVRHVGSVGGSSDSCPLSVPSLAGDLSLASHNAVSSLPLSFDKSEGKKRKNSSSSSKACKITKMPGMNSVHKKNPPGLLAPVPDPVNSTSSRQVGKNSSLPLSQSSPSSISSPGHSRQKTTNRTGRIRTLP